MVMSTSMWKSEPVLKGLDQDRMIDDFRLGCIKSLGAWDTHQHPMLNALVGSILLQHFTLRRPHADAAFVATIVLQAQSIGLHREFEGTLDSYSREYRRRVWWHIVWFDVQTSLATGSPPAAVTCCMMWNCRIASDMAQLRPSTGQSRTRGSANLNSLWLCCLP